MPQQLILVTLVIGSYALGCIVGAYYLVRWRTGRDLRLVGSGNAGARNAGRVLGSAGFVGALLIDAGKGALATWIGLQISPQPIATTLAMSAVVAGHVWPFQLGFRGGKGAATAIGIMLVFDPFVTLMMVIGGLLILAFTRQFTVAGLTAIALSPAGAAWRGHTFVEVIGLTIVAAAIVFAHRTNLNEYRTGIGKRSPTRDQETAR